MKMLRQSTAVDLPLGPFLDESDGKTAETTLTITQPDIRLKKNGGNWAQKNAAQTLSHEENGYYEVSLDSTDTNTLGILRIAVHESGALPVWDDYLVVPADVYDAIVNGTGNGVRATNIIDNATSIRSVSVTQWNGSAVATPDTAGYPKVTIKSGTGTGEISLSSGAVTVGTLPTIPSNWISASGIASDAITSAKVADGFITAAKIASNAITSAKIATDAIGAAQLAADAVTEIQSGLATAAALTTVDSVVDAIQAKTDNLPASPAAVGSAMTLTSGERTAVANEVEAQIIDDTDSEKVLEAITDKIAEVNPDLGGLTIGAIASAVRTELTTELGRLDVAVSTRLAPTNAGRTLDVTVTGEAGIDLANIGSPTTTVNLSGLTIKTATDVETDTADIQTRLPGALTAGGNMKSDALAISGDTGASDNLEAILDGNGGSLTTTGGTLTLREINVTNGVVITAVDKTALFIQGIGAADGMEIMGGTTNGDGLAISAGGAGSPAMAIYGTDAVGLAIQGGGSAAAMVLLGGGTVGLQLGFSGTQYLKGNIGGTLTGAVTLPTIPANWITSAGVTDGALNGKGDWNTTTPPTAAANASAVRTELATELARIDTTVGSRLASGSYSAPPSAEDVAEAVRTELAPELAHIDADISSISGGGGGGGGDGDVLVDHNYGSDDALQIVSGGVGIDGVTIRAYLSSDYSAGNYIVRATAFTGTDGRWVTPMMLDSGTYTLVGTKDGRKTITVEVTVDAD